ncbi:MAG: hypothetical protein ACI4UB_06225 [Limosilactobacillus sp.]
MLNMMVYPDLVTTTQENAAVKTAGFHCLQLSVISADKNAFFTTMEVTAEIK